jgi:hypothetical protein
MFRWSDKIKGGIAAMTLRNDVPVVRPVCYLLNVLVVIGTVGVLVLGSHTKPHGIGHPLDVKKSQIGKKPLWTR